jgi:hypothetical protein
MQYEDVIGEIDADGNPVSYAWENFFGNFEKDPNIEMVNSPAHYTAGRIQVIEVIEDAIRSAEDPVAAMLQGQVLKYTLRMWLKGKPAEDAQKAQWYLNRLVEHMTNNA